MNLKQKVKTYSFWISLISAILIVVRIIGEQCNWFINESFVMDIATGVCGVLVLLGILSAPTTTTKSESTGETPMINTTQQLQSQNTDIIKEQENLNTQIKQDLSQSANSIEEQIEILKNKFAQTKNQVVNNAENEKSTEQLVVTEEPVVLADDIQQPIEDLTPNYTNITQTVAESVVAQIDMYSANLQEVTPVVNVNDNNSMSTFTITEKVNEQPESTKVLTTDLTTEENKDVIDISSLSTQEIKELLVQILNRL